MVALQFVFGVSAAILICVMVCGDRGAMDLASTEGPYASLLTVEMLRWIKNSALNSQFLNGPGNGNRQDSIRLSTGFAFTFGN